MGADAGYLRQGDPDCRASVMPVVVYPPDEDGGRRVRGDGEILGRAYERGVIAESGLIEWRGDGPDSWEH
jgi:hypothetical protein